MADFLIPMKLEICIKDIDEDELYRYIDDFRMGLTQMFMSDDPDDDHFRIMEVTPRYSQIKETEYVD